MNQSHRHHETYIQASNLSKLIGLIFFIQIKLKYFYFFRVLWLLCLSFFDGFVLMVNYIEQQFELFHYPYNLFYMRTGHRRTPAKPPIEDNIRFSVPTHYQPPKRLSFQPQQISPIFMRASDISYMTSFQPQSLKYVAVPENYEERQPRPKLIETFNSLQQKLAQAKKQLNIEKKHTHRKESSFQLKSWKESSNLQTPEDSFLGKIEESTINLESQKKLMYLKSKQKLPWVSKIKSYYISEVAKGIVGLNDCALEHINLSHQVLKASKTINLPDETVIPRSKINLPQAPGHKGRKVLVLDLDETLFHSSDERVTEDDLQIDIPCQETSEKAFIAIRPFAISFLKKMNKHFEIIAFTASEKSYADAILDELDPQGKLIHHRLYRNHCVKLNHKIYAKDLSMINRQLSQMVLIDNSPLSYLYQVENGVPVLPYYGGDDTELLQLEKYLDLLRKEEDVRELNRKTFKLQSYWYFSDVEELVQDLYCDNIYF